jgi:hypothetical protein
MAPIPVAGTLQRISFSSLALPEWSTCWKESHLQVAAGVDDGSGN